MPELRPWSWRCGPHGRLPASWRWSDSGGIGCDQCRAHSGEVPSHDEREPPCLSPWFEVHNLHDEKPSHRQRVSLAALTWVHRATARPCGAMAGVMAEPCWHADMLTGFGKTGGLPVEMTTHREWATRPYGPTP